MKTTFSRTLFPAAIILLAALLLVGTGFQVLVRNYMDESAIESLKSDGSAISSLASAYYAEGSLSDRAFLTNLSVISQVTDSDAVICNATGQLVLCSDAPLGCEHQGMVIDQTYLQNVLKSDYLTDTGMINGLYSDARYVVSLPIHDPFGRAIGIVIVSSPMTQTRLLLDRMSDIFLFVSVLVVLVAMLLITLFARQQAQPLREMAKAARAFGHGQLNARVQVDKSSPEEVQELVRTGQLSAGHARVLAGLEDDKRKLDLAKQTIEKAWSVRQLEAVAAEQKQDKPAAPKARTLPVELTELEGRIRETVGMRAAITGNVKKGKIVLQYYSREELERFYELLNRIAEE